MTVDVEDYFQVSAFEKAIPYGQWGEFESRVEHNTNRILELFDSKGVNGTFFVLGWIAERYPELIKEIARRGHEIACHGYSHQLVYNQTPEVFREESYKSKALLEDITGLPVIGYRAASYSITPQSRWALDTLVELGFKYDSSLFPVYHDRYGMPGIPLYPYSLETDKGNKLVEFPLSTYGILGYRLPVSGGGYFRLYPYWFSRWCLGSINRSHKSFVFYLHPWEIDPDQPRVDVSGLSKFRHYNNLEKCYSRMEKLLTDFQFGTMRSVLQDLNLYVD